MAAVSGPEQVYNRFVSAAGYDEDGDPDAIALFSYALVEKDRYDWIAHHRQENGGAPPSDSDMESWFRSKPDSYFREKQSFALSWYKSFARSLLEDEIEWQRKEAIKEYIGAKLGFLNQLWISLVCNFAFLVLVGAVAAYIFSDFSPIDWVKAHLFPGSGH